MGFEENYRELSISIIKRAAADWTKAIKKLRRNPKSAEAQRLLRDTESFFQSDWCFELGGVDGKYILRKLQEELIG